MLCRFITGEKHIIAVIVLLWFALLPGLASGQHGAIAGMVLDEGNQPLAGAQVWLEGYPQGTAADTSGRYFIEVPMHGEYRVVYQFIGYVSETLSVRVNHGERVRRDVRLKQAAIPQPGVETKASREVVHETKTPEPTVIIPAFVAERTGKTSIGEAAELEAGIQLQKRCSACEASEVSIQGLPGRFSLVLLEGLPVFSSLASRYVLDMVPVEFIDRLEVLKGASGAIWGSDAIAGAVNIRLLQPAKPLQARATYTRRSFGNDLSSYLGTNLNPVAVSLIAAHNNRDFLDLNRDGISENTAYRRNLILGNLDYYPGLSWRLGAGGSFGDEVRRAGAMVPDSLYYKTPLAEKVLTRRWDLWQRTGYTVGANEFGVRLAASEHNESGILEMRDYSARQSTLFGELSASFARVTTGVSGVRHTLRDTRLFQDAYDENNLGLWAAGKNLSLPFLPLANDLIPALRVDLNSDYGLIPSPYLALGLYPGWLDLNLAAGTGFRTPTVIFESMENLPGGFRYAIRRDSVLRHESSVSLQAGATKTVVSGRFVANLRLNLFHHRVGDFISADLQGIDTATQRATFYYHNLPDAALSSGAELSANLVFPKDLTATVNTYLLAPRTELGRTLPFIRRWAVGYSAAWRPKGPGFELNLAGELNGPMLVQTVHAGGTIERYDSPVYSVFNLRLSQNLKLLSLSAGVNNLWDFHQPPFSHHAARADYYWGPIVGRELYLTASVNI